MVRPVDGGGGNVAAQSINNNNRNEAFAGELERVAVRHTPRHDPGNADQGEARLSPAPGYEGIDSGIGVNPELSRGAREEDDTPRQGLSEANPPWRQDGDFIYPPDNGIIYK